MQVARFVTNTQQNTSTVGDMLQHFNWCYLEDRYKDDRLVMVYKIANENVAINITEQDIHKSLLR